MSDFDLKYLKGVGEARAKLLASECDIHSIRDLLYYFPTRYVDRSRFYMISELDGEMPAVQIKGRFIRFLTEGEGAKQRLKGIFTDGKSIIEVVWFSQIKHIRESLRGAVEYVIFGKPNFYRGYYSFAHPEIEPFNPQRPPEGFRGVYNLTEALRKRNFTQKVFQKIIYNALSMPRFEIGRAHV